MKITVEVRTWREKYGIKAKDIAAFIGISPSGYCRYESGERSIPCDVYAQMACALGNREMLVKKLETCPVYQALKKTA